MEDLQLWSQLKAGKPEAFKEIYDAHIDWLLQYGLRFSRTKEEVEDCVHDLFIYIWKNREGLSDTDSIKRYLLVSLRRRIIKGLRQDHQELNDSMHFDAELTIEDRWIDIERQQESQKSLQKALDKLSSRQREAIYLKYHQAMSYESICEIMSINYQSARNLIANGIQAMRKIMSSIILFVILMTNSSTFH